MNKPNSIQASRPLKALWISVQIFWYLSWFAAGLLLLVAGATFVFDKNIKYTRLPVEVSFEESGEGSPFMRAQRDAEIPIVGFSDVTMNTEDFDGANRGVVIPLFLIAGQLWIIFHLRKFLRTVKSGRPFDPDNSRRVKMIGWAVTAAGPVVGFLNYIYALDYLEYLDIEGATIETDWGVYPYVIVLGLLILVIGQVLDVGSRLQREQDLTV